MGLYNAEIVDKIGKMIGAMTYGASADKAIAHFELALENNPASPIAHMEYGNGLYMLYGDKALDQVTELYVAASELQAAGRDGIAGRGERPSRARISPRPHPRRAGLAGAASCPGRAAFQTPGESAQ